MADPAAERPGRGAGGRGRPLPLACTASLLLALAACSQHGGAASPAPALASPPPTAPAPGLALSGEVSPVHDPTIVMEGGLAHVFSTSQIGEAPGLIHWRTSTDLLAWTRAGAVFSEMPRWAAEEVPGTRGIWAPDVSYVNGEFRLYYSVSRFGENASAIGLVVTKTLVRSDPRFGWVDRGLVFRSRLGDDLNAIDPDLLVDDDGRHWLSFGSFWSGIKAMELDPVSGKALRDPPQLHDLARRNPPGAIEAPKMILRNGWFYLFASVEFCCRGVDSSYYTIVGRAASPLGPFRDREGRSMNGEGGGMILLHADQDPSRRWVGPGHVGVLAVGGHDYVVYHAYDRLASGRPTLRIQRIDWSPDGWPVAQ